MKRLLTLALCVCVLACAQSALAATGDKVILRAGANGAESLSVVALAYSNGVIYIMDDEKLYIYDGDLRALDYQIPLRSGITNAEARAMLSDGDKLRVLAAEYTGALNSYQIEGITLYTLEIAPDGAAAFTDPVALDYLSFMQIDGDDEYLNYIRTPFIQDGVLVYVTSTDYGRAVMTYDLSTHSANELYVDNLDGMSPCVSPYKSGKALVLLRDRGNSGSGASEQYNLVARFCALDLKSGETEELFSINIKGYYMPEGAAYDADTNNLYYALNNELYRVEDMRPETNTSVNALLLESYTDKLPLLTRDGFYVACDYKSVVMCNTDPNARAARKLVIQNNYMHSVEQAFYDFTAAHDDVEARLVDTVGDVITAMTTRDGSIDIYSMNANQLSYASLYSRGYLAELTGSEKLSEYVSGMYPAIRDIVEKDGELYALPVLMESYSTLGMDAGAMRTLGISVDDIPGTWLELIDFFKAFPALAQAHPEVTLFESDITRDHANRTLISRFWRDYLIRMLNTPGADMSFDTPAFRSVLKGLSDIDYDALGVPEEEDDAYDSGRSSALIITDTDITASAISYQNTFPMPLAFEEGDTPIIRVTLYLLMVNPYSQNRELAIEFLEMVADNTTALTLTHLCERADAPVVNENYDRQLQSQLDYIDSLISAIEMADESEKFEYQERLDERREALEQFKLNRKYSATAESIAWYRTYAQYFKPDEYFGLSSDDSIEVNALIYQYIDGAINADTLIKSLDNKLRMMLLEGA